MPMTMEERLDHARASLIERVKIERGDILLYAVA
jgi:hypothetical protein